MIFKEQIHDYIQQHKGEIVDTLKELIRIPSVRGEAEDNAPFGKECARVLEFTQRLYESYTFETELDVDCVELNLIQRHTFSKCFWG